VPARDRVVTPGRDPAPATAGEAPFAVEVVFDVLAEALPPDTVYVNESTSNTGAFWERVRLDRPHSLYFPAAGGLGWGLPAAIGVQLAEPGRPVVAVLGDGAVQYAVSGLWTAVRYGTPVTFVVLRNSSYGALKWFARHLGVGGLPGMELPGLDAVTIAHGYGLTAEHVTDRGRLADLLGKAATRTGPLLIEVPILDEASFRG
jgi:benzoylformate decarboxylase